MKQILHVGMGKCASTYLQMEFFPRVQRHYPSINYLPQSDLVRKIRTCQRLGSSFISPNFEFQQEGLHSCEDLIGWNPSHWDTAIEDMASIVPRNSRIILILRDPFDYLQSLYVQQVKSGHVVNFDEWWTKGDLGRNVITSNPRFGFRHINIDHLDYEYLVKLLAAKFDDLVVMTLSSVYNLDTLCRAFEIPLDEIKKLNIKSNLVNQRLTEFQVKSIKRINAIMKFFGLQFNDMTTAHNLLKFGSKNTSQNRFTLMNFLIKSTSLIPSSKFSVDSSELRKNITLKKSEKFVSYIDNEYGGLLQKL